MMHVVKHCVSDNPWSRQLLFLFSPPAPPTFNGPTTPPPTFNVEYALLEATGVPFSTTLGQRRIFFSLFPHVATVSTLKTWGVEDDSPTADNIEDHVASDLETECDI